MAKLMHESVEVGIGNLWCVEFVVQVQVMGDLLTKFVNTSVGINRIGHDGDASGRQ